MLLAIRDPELDSDIVDQDVTISFTSGPNTVTSTWFAGCYPTQPNLVAEDACDLLIAYGEAAAYETGTLPRLRETVSATLDLSDVPNTDLDCFVGVLDDHGTVKKCSYVESGTTNVAAPLVIDVTSVPGGNELLVHGVPATNGELPANGNARSLTYQMQCLDASSTSPTECDETGAWVEVPYLPIEEVVGSLTPNTNYACFVAATYVENAVTQYVCSEPFALTPTAVAAPTVAVAAGTNPQTDIDVSGTSTNGNAVGLTYQVQCQELAGPTPYECDPTGIWVTATDLATGATVSGLTANTEYVCFTAATWQENTVTQYECSGPSAMILTAPAGPTNPQATIVGVADPTTQLMVTATPPDAGEGVTLTFKVQCLPATGPGTPSTCNENAAWQITADLAAGEVVDGLSPDTQYYCFAAATYNDGGEQYLCSGPSAITATTGWTPRSIQDLALISNSNDLFSSVAYGDTTFAAVATGGPGTRAIVSLDGITWTTSAVTGNLVLSAWESVTYGGGNFVAVASSGGAGDLVMLSGTDGNTWVAATSYDAESAWSSVAYGGPAGSEIFVAVARSGLAAERVMLSIDGGVNWDLDTYPAGAESDWESITYGDGKFVAVASSGAAGALVMVTTTSGWQLASSYPFESAWQSVTYGDGKFVAVANSGSSGERVMVSTDGGDIWTAATSYPADVDWRSVTYGGPAGQELFVAVASTGAAGERVMVSEDGLIWESVTYPANNDWTGVAWGEGLFAAVSSTGINRVMTSYTGLS